MSLRLRGCVAAHTLTGILNNQIYVGRRAYARQTSPKDADNGRRHASPNVEEKQAPPVAAPALGIVSEALRQSVEDRQQAPRRGPPMARDTVPAPPFFVNQRPKRLTAGKMTCGECGSGHAKSSRNRLGCH